MYYPTFSFGCNAILQLIKTYITFRIQTVGFPQMSKIQNRLQIIVNFSVINQLVRNDWVVRQASLFSYQTTLQPKKNIRYLSWTLKIYIVIVIVFYQFSCALFQLHIPPAGPTSESCLCQDRRTIHETFALFSRRRRRPTRKFPHWGKRQINSHSIFIHGAKWMAIWVEFNAHFWY